MLSNVRSPKGTSLSIVTDQRSVTVRGPKGPRLEREQNVRNTRVHAQEPSSEGFVREQLNDRGHNWPSVPAIVCVAWLLADTKPQLFPTKPNDRQLFDTNRIKTIPRVQSPQELKKVPSRVDRVGVRFVSAKSQTTIVCGDLYLTIPRT